MNCSFCGKEFDEESADVGRSDFQEQGTHFVFLLVHAGYYGSQKFGSYGGRAVSYYGHCHTCLIPMIPPMIAPMMVPTGAVKITTIATLPAVGSLGFIHWE